MCAICSKPVDKVEAHDSFERFGMLFRVFCHGEVEEQWLTDYEVIVADAVTFGTAFYRLALTDEQQIKCSREEAFGAGQEPTL
jgi:hypothetical protein